MKMQDVLLKSNNEKVKTVVSQDIKAEDFIKVSGSKPYLFFKRMFDIVLSFVLGVLLLVPMLIIAVWIKLDSDGPVLFRQERLGKGGEPFIIYKFRSMRTDAEKDGPRWAEVDDERVTRAGHFLRRTRLDELPQIWNVFIGNMSIVGPRPEREFFYSLFEQYVPGFRNRLIVKPGVTGLAQVNGGYELDPASKLKFDMEYIERRSASLDIMCMLKTVKVVFTQEGAR
ncbi:MAG: sugar transferase [Acutalibacteraceae bacterium]